MKHLQTIVVILIVIVLWIILGVYANQPKKGDASSTGTTTASTAVTTADPAVTGTTAETASTEVSTMPTSTNADIDNAWALFLVNQQHPLAESFTVKTKTVQNDYVLDERAAEYFLNMLLAADKDGVKLKVASAYRPVSYQQMLFDNDVKRNEAKGMTKEEATAATAKVVAVPGTSEHNVGLAADIVGTNWYDTHSELTEEFDTTPEFKWLQDNCYKFGFILRYPKGKESLTSIIYEPWHYRFVGVYHATRIMQQGVCLEEYIAAQK